MQAASPGVALTQEQASSACAAAEVLLHDRSSAEVS